MALVLHHSKASGTALTILLGIANHEGDGGSWPSITTLAKYGRCTERRVQQIINKLIEDGELTVELQAGGLISTRADKRPNLYRVLVSCPPECDRTSNHRVRQEPPTPTDPPRGEAGFTPQQQSGVKSAADGVKPASPEPSLEPSFSKTTGMERVRDRRCAPAGTRREDDGHTNDQEKTLPVGDRGLKPKRPDWRVQDQERFAELIEVDTLWTDEGEPVTVAELYEQCRNRKPTSIRWPGRLLQGLYDKRERYAVEDWLMGQGLALYPDDPKTDDEDWSEA